MARKESKTTERLKTAASEIVSSLISGVTAPLTDKMVHGTVSIGDIEEMLQRWHVVPRKLAQRLIQKYGAPNEATSSRLIWFNNDIWKRTVVFRDEIAHNFPSPHTDILMQTINYKVPVAALCDLGSLDGSLIVNRTAGELSAYCDSEDMNVLALNMAHNVITGAMTVARARKTMTDNSAAYLVGGEAPYMEKLLFDIPSGDTVYRDKVGSTRRMAAQATKKVEEILSKK